MSLKKRARNLKIEVYTLYLVARHRDTPWYAKLLAAAVVAYVFSPIDLIPDFIPVLGYLDDLVLVSLGIALAIRMVPPSVYMECCRRAQDVAATVNLVSYTAAAVIVIVWLTLIALCGFWIYKKIA